MKAIVMREEEVRCMDGDVDEVNVEEGSWQ
jgi:hypothetical protein